LLITFLSSAIIYVSQLAKENSITLIQGVLVFMISILAALLLIGIYLAFLETKLKKQKSHSHAKDFQVKSQNGAGWWMNEDQGKSDLSYSVLMEEN